MFGESGVALSYYGRDTLCKETVRELQDTWKDLIAGLKTCQFPGVLGHESRNGSDCEHTEQVVWQSDSDAKNDTLQIVSSVTTQWCTIQRTLIVQHSIVEWKAMFHSAVPILQYTHNAVYTTHPKGFNKHHSPVQWNTMFHSAVPIL